MTKTEIHEGGGNVFADLALPDADEMLLKANLVARLRSLIGERKLTQTKAAEIAGLGQADMSRLLRGSLRGYSVERLMRMLTAFDQDVEITIRPRRTGEAGRITLVA